MEMGFSLIARLGIIKLLFSIIKDLLIEENFDIFGKEKIILDN